MSTENKKSSKISSSLTDEEMQHEIHYLRDRLDNLETFKRLFFELKQQNEKNIESVPSVTSEHEAANSVIGFIHESASVVNYQDLVMLFFNAVLEFDLDVLIQFNCVQEDLSYSPNGQCSEQEIELLSQVKNKGGVFEKENMLCVNFDYVSLVINRWSEAAEKETKKMVLLLCESLNDKVKSIEMSISSNNEIENLQKTIDTAYEVLSEIKIGVNEKVEKIDVIQSNIIKKASTIIAKLNLNEKQKKTVLALLSSCMKKQGETLVSSLQLNDRLNELTHNLKSTEKKQNKEVQMTRANHTPNYQ